MSVCFGIKPSSSSTWAKLSALWGRNTANREVLTIQSCLSLVDNLTQYSYQEDEIAELLPCTLSEVECVIVGIEDQAGRGFEISYDDDAQEYGVRVNTPATTADWQAALAWMQALGRSIGGIITSERGEIFRPENIQDFDYRQDISAGIGVVYEQLMDDDMENVKIYGVIRPTAIDKTIIERIYHAASPIEAFDRFMIDGQNLDAYTAKQALYRNKDDNGIVGVYTLSQDLPTILPFSPAVEWEHLEEVGEQEVDNWYLALAFDGFEQCDFDDFTIDYAQFISQLTEAQYHFVDAEYILVHPLHKQEMLDLLERAKTQTP